MRTLEQPRDLHEVLTGADAYHMRFPASAEVFEDGAFVLAILCTFCQVLNLADAQILVVIKVRAAHLLG